MKLLVAEVVGQKLTEERFAASRRPDNQARSFGPLHAADETLASLLHRSRRNVVFHLGSGNEWAGLKLEVALVHGSSCGGCRILATIQLIRVLAAGVIARSAPGLVYP